MGFAEYSSKNLLMLWNKELSNRVMMFSGLSSWINSDIIYYFSRYVYYKINKSMLREDIFETQ